MAVREQVDGTIRVIVYSVDDGYNSAQLQAEWEARQKGFRVLNTVKGGRWGLGLWRFVFTAERREGQDVSAG